MGVESESGVPRSPGFGPESQSYLKETLTPGLSALSGLMCNFVAVYLTSVYFILQLKLCFYTVMHFLVEKFKINFSKVIFKYTIIMPHNKSYSRSRSLES